ncbi:hypothetical protein HPB47_003176 [Ixodes persulcatus]|uniref:Uncharacterized protein n=1 Tax=Ixodes persulcatus TaxID=34615 RepID=A0AC60PKP0_IXOPE|nr:hypothetical protein HPB47_003176 [Ixodes persulcatus]
MISGAWTDMRSNTIADCFKSGGFTRTRLPDSAAAGDEAFAANDDPAVAEDYAPAVAEICAPLERLWESKAKDQLVPSSVDLVRFLTTEDDVVATEVLTEEALANCGPVNAEAGSESDESDDDSAKKSVSAGTALAAVETLRDYFAGAERVRLGQSLFPHFDAIEHAIVKRSLTRCIQSRINGYFGKH